MNPLLGVFLHAIGGFASASFYVPIKFVKKWSWEVAWLAMGLVAWLITPMVAAAITMPTWFSAIAQTDVSVLLLTALFGGMWGFGNVTYGLSMRYLGLGLGVAVALGTCAVFGTLIPPIVGGKFLDVLTTPGGQIVMMGVVVGVLGIVVNGIAGVLKERDSSNNEALPEFNLPKGICVAVVSGILSAGFAFSLSMGEPIAETARKIAVDTGALAPESADFFKNNATLVVTLWGGFISNFLICGYMILYSVRGCRSLLVWAILLLWNGNNPVGQGVRLFKLVFAHVVHHSICRNLGVGAARMERQRNTYKMRFVGWYINSCLLCVHNRLGPESVGLA